MGYASLVIEENLLISRAKSLSRMLAQIANDARIQNEISLTIAQVSLVLAEQIITVKQCDIIDNDYEQVIRWLRLLIVLCEILVEGIGNGNVFILNEELEINAIFAIEYVTLTVLFNTLSKNKVVNVNLDSSPFNTANLIVGNEQQEFLDSCQSSLCCHTTIDINICLVYTICYYIPEAITFVTKRELN
jgi:hypothetical protein